jgi:hypothetical protein
MNALPAQIAKRSPPDFVETIYTAGFEQYNFSFFLMPGYS